MSFSLVVGNGISRRVLDNSVYENKTTWACNLAYRDFAPTNLVICDKLVLITAMSEGAASRTKVWTRSRWFGKLALDNVETLPDSSPWAARDRWDEHMNIGSGLYAAIQAAAGDEEIIVLVGFDLWPTKMGRFNNCYAGEKHYADKNSDGVDPAGWITQFTRLFAHYPQKQFVFLNNTDWHAPEEWGAYENFNSDDISQVNSI